MKQHLRNQWRMATQRIAAAANSLLWFHGTHSPSAMASIIQSQELIGSGDFGRGGYVTSDPHWAGEYGNLVAVILEPRNPRYGGEKEAYSFHGDYNATLRAQGVDVWFPTDGSSPSNPGDLAIILDPSAAKFFRAPRGVRYQTARTADHDKLADAARTSRMSSLHTAMMANKYPGRCTGCTQYVERGEGFYDGSLWCSEPKERQSVVVDGEEVFVEWFTCDRGRRIEAREILKAREFHRNRQPVEPTPEEKAAQEKRQRERAAEDAAWAKRGLQRCKRCGGAGGSSSWPGWACFDCNGVGATPKPF